MTTIRMVLRLNPRRRREHAGEGMPHLRPEPSTHVTIARGVTLHERINFHQPPLIAWVGTVMLLERCGEMTMYGCRDDLGDFVEFRVADQHAVLGAFALESVARSALYSWVQMATRDESWASYRDTLIRNASRSILQLRLEHERHRRNRA